MAIYLVESAAACLAHAGTYRRHAVESGALGLPAWVHRDFLASARACVALARRVRIGELTPGRYRVTGQEVAPW